MRQPRRRRARGDAKQRVARRQVTGGRICRRSKSSRATTTCSSSRSLTRSARSTTATLWRARTSARPTRSRAPRSRRRTTARRAHARIRLPAARTALCAHRCARPSPLCAHTAAHATRRPHRPHVLRRAVTHATIAAGGLQHGTRRLRVEQGRHRARRRRRQAGDRGGAAPSPPRRRHHWPDQPHPLDLAVGGGPGRAQLHVGRGAHGVQGAGGRPGRRRLPHPHGRDHLRLSQREGCARRHRRVLRRFRLPAAARDHLRHRGGHVGAHALRPDHRGLLRLDAALQAALHRAQLRPRRRQHGALHPGARRRGRVLCARVPERGAAQRHGRLRRDARELRLVARGLCGDGARQHARRLLRHHAGAHQGARRDARQGQQERRVEAAAAQARLWRDAHLGARAAHRRQEPRLPECRRAVQHRRLGQVQEAHPQRRLRQGARDCARAGRVGRAGDRRQHGRGPTRRRVRDEQVPQPDRARARHL